MNTNLRRKLHGINPVSGGRPVPVVAPQGVSQTRRPLIDQLLSAQVLSCGFRSIPLAAPSIAANQSAWYGLGVWDEDSIGQQAAVVGYVAQLAPPRDGLRNDDDLVASEMTNWGTTDGGGCALVIGVDLPIKQGQWTSGPNNVAWVEAPGTVRSHFQPAGLESVTLHFPPTIGSTAAPTSRSVITNQHMPLCWPITQGRKIGVALVVRRSFVHGITKTNGIVGYCDVQLYTGGTRSRTFNA